MKSETDDANEPKAKRHNLSEGTLYRGRREREMEGGIRGCMYVPNKELINFSPSLPLSHPHNYHRDKK